MSDSLPIPDDRPGEAAVFGGECAGLDPARPDRSAGRMASRPQYLLDLLRRQLEASFAAIGLLSPEQELTEFLASGDSPESAAEYHRQPWTRDVILHVLRQPVPTRLDDLAALAPALAPPVDLPRMGPFLGIPLHHQGRHQGAICFWRPPGARPFDGTDEQLALPAQAWLEPVELFGEARLLSHLHLLTRVAQSAAGSLDLVPILTVALRELDRHMPVHVSVVWLINDSEAGAKRAAAADSASSRPDSAVNRTCTLADCRTFPMARAAKLGLTPGLRVDLDQTPFAPCITAGQALYLDLNLPSAKDPISRGLIDRGANSHFVVPLRSGDRTVGILQSICTRSIGFTHEQIQLLYLVGDLLGPAISNCHLHGRLRSAYQELRTTQSQLIQAEKMRALGELAGGMAHDFNNSLCGVLGFLELTLADPELPSSLKGYLESARTCTLDAAQAVRRVQSFARWQRNELSVQVLDLNELVRQTLELTRPKWESLIHARGKPITVEVHTEATGWVSGSAAELREVITNLVFNAVDAMPNGGQLTVHTWNTESTVCFSVRDTGVGMSDSVRLRLFEPFFTTKGERGNGLGLSVTFGIVQRYGGEIRVESSPGQGSTFTVELPSLASQASGAPEGEATVLPMTPQRPSNGTAAKEPHAPPGPAMPRSLRILVIEDEESIRRFLDRGLTQMGHHPRLACDGKEGLTAFAEEHFDLVLTDLGLPGLSGEEVARSIAQTSPRTPVVLLTGWSNQLRDEARPLEGVSRILGKPVTLKTLATTLTDLCA